MTKTKYGYLHGRYGPDMDGSYTTFEWIEDRPMEGEPQPVAGWFAFCEVQPEAGWLGPFETEEQAIHAATTEDGFTACQYGDNE